MRQNPKEKHERFGEVQQYLKKHQVVTIRVKPNSKYNINFWSYILLAFPMPFGLPENYFHYPKQTIYYH